MVYVVVFRDSRALLLDAESEAAAVARAGELQPDTPPIGVVTMPPGLLACELAVADGSEGPAELAASGVVLEPLNDECADFLEACDAIGEAAPDEEGAAADVPA
jgi:hypothetical protein